MRDVREITFGGQREIAQNFSVVQPLALEAAANLASNLGDVAARKAEVMRDSAVQRYNLSIDNEIHQEINRISNDNMGDPMALQASIDGFKKGYLPKILGDDIKERAGFSIDAISAPHIKRSQDAKQKRDDTELELLTLENINNSKNAISNLVPDLISSDPETVVLAGQAAQVHMSNVINSLRRTKSDGTPMFTPEQIFSRTEAARNMMLTQAVRSAVDANPNRLQALSDWRSGRIELALPDENGQLHRMNIRDSLDDETREKIDRDIVSNIKDEISILNSIDSRQEKLFRERSEQVSAEMEIKMQDGTLTMQELELNRNSIDPNIFVDLRKMVLSDDPTTNQAVFGDIYNRAVGGEDVTELARFSRFTSKNLNNNDFKTILQEIKSNRDQKASGVIDPVTNARRFVVESLGGLAELDAAGSIAIANAKRGFENQLQAFQEVNNRLPNQQEAFTLADAVVDEFQIFDSERIIQAQPKPSLLPISEKNVKSLTQERITQLRNDTIEHYMALHNGSKEAIVGDTLYQREMDKIRKMEQVIQNIQKVKRQK